VTTGWLFLPRSVAVSRERTSILPHEIIWKRLIDALFFAASPVLGYFTVFEPDQEPLFYTRSAKQLVWTLDITPALADFVQQLQFSQEEFQTEESLLLFWAWDLCEKHFKQAEYKAVETFLTEQLRDTSENSLWQLPPEKRFQIMQQAREEAKAACDMLLTEAVWQLKKEEEGKKL
jgi:hypothetical protein